MKHVLAITAAVILSGCVVAPAEPVPSRAATARPGDVALVCHKNMRTVQVPAEAVQAHVNHGDRTGAC
jgi:hypothetical protein